MKRFMRGLALVMAAVMALTGCVFASGETQQEDIIILFTSDVHCGIEEDIGYAGLAAYRDACLARTPYVTLIDCGDAIQGDVIGVVSQGEYIVDIMNQVGYDYAIPGNHEFDFGVAQLARLMEKSNAQYLSANITYTGEGDSVLPEMEPYVLETYGDTTVAFIGVTTPWTPTSSTPSNFMDDSGEYVYDFCGGGEGEELYALVQRCVDECRESGADYVVLLTHLGDIPTESPYSAVDVIENVTGVDAVLDGHAHTVVPTRFITDAEGKDVLLVASGTKLDNIGRLVITPSGGLYGGLVSSYETQDADTALFIRDIQALYEESVNRVVAHSDTALACYDGEGYRLVRCRETGIGNLCADAYRDATGADIAAVNGGGIRADIPAGDITYGDLIAVHPYGNSLCLVEATGQEILDMLEVASRFTEAEYKGDEWTMGEDGGFLHVSGMRYTIDTSVAHTVVTDDMEWFQEVSGARRVKNVEVLNQETGEYEPLDPEKTYTFASHNYLIKECGNGQNMFVDNVFIIDEGMLDYEVVIQYLTGTLGGVVPAEYFQPEGRITIE